MKTGILYFLTIILAVFAVSCNEDEVSFNAEADAFTLIHYDQDGVPVFANAYYLYGNKSMKDVVVNTPDGNAVELSPNGSINSTYYLEPQAEDFQPYQPAPGTYDFEATTNDDNVHIVSDQLESSFIMPVNITQGVIEDNVLKVKWDQQSDALAYIFRVVDENQDDPQVLLSTGFIETDSINASLSSVQFSSEMPVAGQDYELEVRAYKFESDKEVNLEYNIQAVSSAKKTINWE